MRYGGFLLLLGALGLGAACSAFDSDEGGGGTEPTVDGGGGPPDAIALPEDGGSVTDGDASQPPCASVAPVPTSFEQVMGAISNLTSDGSYVYWLLDGKTIRRKALAAGSAPETIYVWSAAGVISAFAPTATQVFLTGPSGAIFVPNVADAGAGGNYGSVFTPIASLGDTVFGYGNSIVFRAVPPAGFGGLVTVPAVTAIAANSAHVLFLSPGGDAGPGSAVWSVVNTMTGAQTSVLRFYSSERSPTALAVDEAEAFMLDPDKREVFKAPLGSAPGPATVLASMEDGLGRIAVKSKKVYYTTAQGIRRVDAAGGCTTVMSMGPTSHFTLTDQDVYFVAGTDIVRVPR